MRDYETLLRQGDEVLAEGRQALAAREDIALLPRPGGVNALDSIGRVVAVNGADAELGPHLVVTLQVWEGQGNPPAPQDVPDADVVCYPTPGRVVADYAAGEFVLMAAAQGAMLAVKLP
jgi:hypothetical protein